MTSGSFKGSFPVTAIQHPLLILSLSVTKGNPRGCFRVKHDRTNAGTVKGFG